MSPEQAELATREIEHECEDCLQVSYGRIAKLEAKFPEAGSCGPYTRANGWREIPHKSGRYLPCVPSTPAYAWVSRIDPAVFDAYWAAHPDPFLVDDLRALLPEAK